MLAAHRVAADGTVVDVDRQLTQVCLMAAVLDGVRHQSPCRSCRPEACTCRWARHPGAFDAARCKCAGDDVRPEVDVDRRHVRRENAGVERLRRALRTRLHDDEHLRVLCSPLPSLRVYVSVTWPPSAPGAATNEQHPVLEIDRAEAGRRPVVEGHRDLVVGIADPPVVASGDRRCRSAAGDGQRVVHRQRAGSPAEDR